MRSCRALPFAVRLLALWFLPGFVSIVLRAQNVIHVPADQPTIQAGINAASNGDTVLVAPGTYTESLDFLGKAITVTSGATTSAGAAATILMGNAQVPAVTFHSGETRSSVLNGFTIQNGLTGIYLPSSSATISNNVINSNIACGIAATGQAAGPLIQGNTISHTRYIPDVECLLPNQPYSQFDENQYDTAIWLLDVGDVEITGNTIANNGVTIPGKGPMGGGAIFSEAMSSTTSLTITNNIIHDNYEGPSPVVHLSYARHVTLVQNLIYSNTNSGSIASGIVANGGGPFFNTTAVDSLVVVNNTVYGNTNEDDPLNSPPQQGNQGGFGTGASTVTPFVIDNNLFIATDQYGTVSCSSSPQSPITYSNNDAFYAGAPQPSQCQGSGYGNLAVDPEFLSTGTGDFHTQRTSPVVGAGTVQALDLPATDLAGKNRTVCGTVDMGVYQTHPIPRITLLSSPNPSVGGSPITFTATVGGNCNVPTGTLTFYDGTAVLGTAVLSSGTATLTSANLTVGTHAITAGYPGDFNFDPSTSSPLTQVVTGYPTSTTLQVSPNPAKAFQAITYSATVLSQFGSPSGTISFYAGAVLLGSAPVGSNGFATLTNASLGAGRYTVTAVYVASTQFATSTSAPIQLEVDGASTTVSLTSAPNPSTFGQNVALTVTVTAQQSSAAPVGTVNLMDGSTNLGTAPLSATGVATFSVSTFAAGSHNLTASYSGSSNANSGVSNPVLQVVNAAAVSVTLTSSLNPANTGQQIVFVATVAAPGSLPTPAGAVTFSDEAGVLAVVPLSNGQAVFTSSTLPVGTHPVVAHFTSASANYLSADSAVLNQVVQAFDFTVSVSATDLNLPRGGYQVLTVTLTPVGGFNHAVQLGCAPLPVYAQCVFDPAGAVSLAGGPQQVQLVVNTDQLFEFGPRVSARRGPPLPSRLPLELAATLPALLFGLGRKRRGLRRAALLLCGLLLAGDALTACSGKQPGATPAGAYTFTLTAVDSSAGGSLAHTVPLSLQVTP